MDKIVINIQLFVIQQQVYIYKDGKCTKHIFNKPIEELKDICYNLCKKNNIHNLIITGPSFAALKLKQELMSSKYNNFDIDIQIINL